MSWSLQRKAVILIIGLVVLLAAGLSTIIGWRSGEDFKQQVGDSLAETAHLMSSRLDQYMWGRRIEVRMLGELSEFKSGKNAVEAQRVLELLRTKAPSFSWIGVTDQEGRVWAATDRILVGQSIAQRPVYTEGMKGEFIGDVHDAVLLATLLPNPDGEPVKFVDISLPVTDSAGQPTGVLAAHLSWKWAEQLEESMFQPMQERRQGEIFVISSQDYSVLLGPKKLMGKKLELESIRRAQNGQTGWVQEEWPDQGAFITGFDRSDGYLDYPGLGWIVLVRQPLAVAHAASNRLQWFIWLAAGLFAVIFAGVGGLLFRAVTQPIAEIAKTADRLRFGSKEEFTTPKGIREIEVLADSLRELVHSLSVCEIDVSQLEGIAYKDRLTNLPNRIGLDAFLSKAQARVLRNSEQVLAILYMDLDGFKAINDTLGHAAGDLVLQETAKRLQNCLRAEEIVARIGGDEFIAVLFVEAGKEKETIGAIATRIIQEVNALIEIDPVTTAVGCSIGCAFWTGTEDLAIVIKQADAAMYQVKKTGKNKYEFA
ncbi:MAG TPA: sensor domain-containing diguanylate cyclase [Negativicutes bacterium]|nr:sensor domain-containing diguanylate cyclase [Negativicutes bacterium]